jgi:hypothetical protein
MVKAIEIACKTCGAIAGEPCTLKEDHRRPPGSVESFAQGRSFHMYRNQEAARQNARRELRVQSYT